MHILSVLLITLMGPTLTHTLQDGYMSASQLSLARQQLYSLLKAVRREAVPLVDAIDIPDEMLNSALGRYDGDVYKHLYEWALKAPRNKKKVQRCISAPM